ncbi:hypothetical protein PVT67_04035 [Gallaecimonas kandeliae]|uniref:hypothetical protein n=1 Tax=Gallaecimonas kandeliae TaxID=3029055 RepID=UPI0026477FF4|nr:hypothetical protein [Gallaecimonas kandeliae]WKE66431.1 hypothetical protein PVT67_04035 [Gallaecimonas kandeliae]
MPSLPKIADLPYHLPTDAKGQLRELAKIISIPQPVIESSGPEAIDAICATILYRHLGQAQRQEAMALIRALPNRQLTGILITRALDTTFVNPQWGMWSLTNKELLEEEAFHSTIDDYASYLGISVSALGAKDFLQTLWKQRKVTRGGIATLVIWVAIAANKSHLNEIREEKDRRSQLKGSSFY